MGCEYGLLPKAKFYPLRNETEIATGRTQLDSATVSDRSWINSHNRWHRKAPPLRDSHEPDMARMATTVVLTVAIVWCVLWIWGRVRPKPAWPTRLTANLLGGKLTIGPATGKVHSTTTSYGFVVYREFAFY
jgi:hypothetical protein